MSGARLGKESEGGCSQEMLCAPATSLNPNSDSGRPVFPAESAPNPRSHQVVTLAFLSERLPASVISERLARSLCDETGSSVVLVRFERPEVRGATNNGMPPACLNGEFHMPPWLNQTAGGFQSLALGVGSEPPSPPGIASLVSQLARHFRHVLVEVRATARSAPWLVECLVRSDLSYLFLQSNADSFQDADRIVRESRTGPGNRGLQVKPIGCLAEGEPSEAFDLLVQRWTTPVHMFIRGCPGIGARDDASPIGPTGSFRADVRRLARQVGGRLAGVALSSGAAKGFAHIGVIQVLEENGIEVDVVAGSSMGAYVGSLWAHGNDGRELEGVRTELGGRWAFWTLIDPVFPPRQGFLRGFAVKRRLMRSLGQARFADLGRPMRIVASNLATLERGAFFSGQVAAAVHASSAVPGICVPVTLDGETYIDGGIVDPLPVDALREMGVSRVIAVNVVPTPERIRSGLCAGRTPARHEKPGLRQLFRKIFPVNQQLNYFARGNLLEILMRSLYGAQIRVAEASCRMADLVLRPDICDDRWLDYRHPGKFIKLGREEAERHLEEIKALVAGKELNHEPKPAPEAVAAIA